MSSKSNDGYNQFPECGNVSVKEEPSTKFDPNDPLQILPDFTSPDMLFEGVQSDDSDDTSNTEPSTSKISKLDGSNSFLEAMEVGDLSYQRREKVQRIWSDEETRLLLHLYGRCLSDIGPHKTFKHKKDMWITISSRFRDKTPKQCEERFKTVLRRRRKWASRMNNPFQGKRMRTPKKDILHFEPECQITIENEVPTKSQTPQFNQPKPQIPARDVHQVSKKSNDQGSNQSKNAESRIEPSAQIQQSITEHNCAAIEATLLEIAAKKEEARERRHKEKMAAIEKLQNMLQKILEGRNCI
ncbi:uncharacterized protein LOC142229535 isoform X1 [Haematobia irritans]|uniref:uncharacterized protein LOC142229535 isoform X1 n=1 Tax=Haematobia irritans TaxID=7368 RepID=UPI003F4FFCE6